MNVPYVYKETLLKVDNVCLSYDGRPILRDLCAEIKDVYIPGRVTGQIVALLGPSGRGKTQTFRILAGLQRPNSGQVLLASENGFQPVKAGEVGVVAQNYPLFAHRTIMGNMMLAALAHEKDAKKAKETVLEGLDNFKLSDKADLYPCQLSGGQRQRVAILQMLICREPFILLDEPFASLDLINIEIACETISHAANLSELNTFIVVTHDVTAAVSLADHIWLLGNERDAQGNMIPGAKIVETYDLLERGLCYEEGAITNPKFMETIREIKDRFRTL
jgi:ABC-type nitrate/sulfonate/bicarbonate transport system ATPase subunit